MACGNTLAIAVVYASALSVMMISGAKPTGMVALRARKKRSTSHAAPLLDSMSISGTKLPDISTKPIAVRPNRVEHTWARR